MSGTEDAEWIDGRCVACHQHRTKEGHDPCIPNLPGVLFACCGHGSGEGYIKFTDGRSLKFVPVEVDLDLPSVRTRTDVPVYQYFNSGRRVFDFLTAKVRLTKEK